LLWPQALRGTRTSTVSLMQRTCLATTSDYSEVNTTHRRDHVAVAASGRQKACPVGARAERGRSPCRPLRERVTVQRQDIPELGSHWLNRPACLAKALDAQSDTRRPSTPRSCRPTPQHAYPADRTPDSFSVQYGHIYRGNARFG
jgi:hypothetical protein